MSKAEILTVGSHTDSVQRLTSCSHQNLLKPHSFSFDHGPKYELESGPVRALRPSSGPDLVQWSTGPTIQKHRDQSKLRCRTEY